jgi:hypothetical protein
MKQTIELSFPCECISRCHQNLLSVWQAYVFAPCTWCANSLNEFGCFLEHICMSRYTAVKLRTWSKGD